MQGIRVWLAPLLAAGLVMACGGGGSSGDATRTGGSGGSGGSTQNSLLAALQTSTAAIPGCSASAGPDCTAEAAPSSAFHALIVDTDGSARIVGDGGLVVTQNVDGSFGKPVAIPGAAGDSLLAIARVSTSALLVAGSNGFMASSLDDGQTWSAFGTNTSGSINALAVAGANVVAAGANGFLLYSYNGGATFVQVPLVASGGAGALTANFYGAAFASDNATLFLTSDAGTVYTTTVAAIRANAGSVSLTPIALGNGNAVSGLVVSDALDFTAVTTDGTVYAWSNGATVSTLGAITDGLFGLTLEGITGLALAPNGNLVAVGGVGGVYVSADQGATWSRVGVQVGTDAAQTPVLVGDGELNTGAALAATSTGVKIVGAGAFVDDLDISTLAVTRDNPWTASWLLGVAAAGNSIWGVGQIGTIIGSTDGGATWTQQFCPGVPGSPTSTAEPALTGWISAVAAGGANTAWLVSGNQICATGNAGSNWFIVLDSPTDLFYSIAAVDAHTVFAGANGAMVMSRNAGSSWSRIPLASLGPVIGISAPSAAQVYATDGSYLASSADGGNTWSSTALPAGETALAISAAPGTTQVFALVQINTGTAALPVFAYKLSVTGDGGVTWTDIPGSQVPFTAINFSAIAAPSASSVFVVGSNGAIFEVATASGKVTTHQYLGSGGRSYSAAVLDPLVAGRVWIGGVDGDIAELAGD
jgi:photosystem II stability/assembly factor-like uncharacterized protein